MQTVDAAEIIAKQDSPAYHESPATGDRGVKPSAWRRVGRPMLFWAHLALGLITGSVILIMGVTGGLLTYQRQIVAWADQRTVPPIAVAGSDRLAVDSLLAVLAAPLGAAPTALLWRAEPNAPLEVTAAGGRRAFVDPTTGAILGRGNDDVRAFFRTVTNWHRWLALPNDNRALGRVITGASNLAFLVLVVSGFVIWWPARFSRVAFRNLLVFRTGLGHKARDFNWHHVIGFWSSIPLAVVVASGVVISYGWASDLVFVMAGEAPPVRGAPAPRVRDSATRDERGEVRTAVVAASVSADSAFVLAQQRVPSWRSVSLALPVRASTGYAMTIDAGTGGQPQQRAQLVVDLNGATKRWQPFDAQTRGRQWRSLLRFAHTGETWGLVGQTLAGLVSFGAAVLVYTGIALSWRRWRGWRRRAGRVA